MDKMTKKERLEAALKGEEVDRIPISIWQHFSTVDQDPVSLAEIQVRTAEKFDYDFIKLMQKSKKAQIACIQSKLFSMCLKCAFFENLLK